MGLTPEEKATLEALNAKANEADDDDDFEIEIWDSEGSGARVPYRKGKSWLNKFGIDLPAPEESDDGSDDDSGNGGAGNRPRGRTGSNSNQRVSTTQKYFGKRPTGK